MPRSALLPPARTPRRRAPRVFLPLLVVFVVAGTLLAAPSAARACSCEASDVAAHSDAATAVFEGRVRAISRSGDPEVGPTRLTVTFEVVQTWKGADAEVLVVTTMSDSAACGVPFEEGRSYLVFAASGAEGVLVAGLCGGTTLREQADADVAALGAGVTPVNVQDAPARVRPTAPGVGGCASCHVGAVEARRCARIEWVACLVAVVTLAAARRRTRSRHRARAPRRALSP